MGKEVHNSDFGVRGCFPKEVMGVKLGTCEGAQELGAARRDPRGKSLEGKRGRTGSTDRRGGEGPFARRRSNRLTGAACVSLPDRRLAPRRDERAGRGHGEAWSGRRGLRATTAARL